MQQCCILKFGTIEHVKYMACRDPKLNATSPEVRVPGTMNKVKVTYTCSALNLVATAAAALAAVAQYA